MEARTGTSTNTMLNNYYLSTYFSNTLEQILRFSRRRTYFDIKRVNGEVLIPHVFL